VPGRAAALAGDFNQLALHTTQFDGYKMSNRKEEP
jgi:hypothetical protein